MHTETFSITVPQIARIMPIAAVTSHKKFRCPTMSLRYRSCCLFLFSAMGYYDNGNHFKNKIGQAAAMLVLLGLGWCVLQAWR
jgi:hypothetical protein